GYNPDDAYKWLQEIERIFRVVEATDAQKVMMATHRLTDEADFWWGNTRQRMIAAGTLMTWNNFKNEFLAKYFPVDVRTKKEIEFLKLEQGNMTVAEYARKFEELSRLCPHIYVAEAEDSKCVKFEGGLRPEIKKAVGYQEIRNFATLVNKSRIYEEDSKASSSYYKARGDKTNSGQNRNKPYDKPNVEQKDKQNATYERETRGGGIPNTPRCFRCGAVGHMIAECKTECNDPFF
ncbi:GRAS family transcription factor, partial [Trifolium medium]|nr:GRAS family transcription factor [Trifolium medium]